MTKECKEKEIVYGLILLLVFSIVSDTLCKGDDATMILVVVNLFYIVFGGSYMFFLEKKSK